MPGIDRSRIVGKSAEELEEFSCGICQDVFNQPMVTPCRHTFCKECIEEWLNGNNTTCPNDRNPLTKRRLTEAPRFVLNIIDRMQIKCRLSDRGCPSVHSVDHDSTHMTVCQFVACRRCGLNDPGPSHDCVAHLLQKNVNLTEDNNQLRTENENLKTMNSHLNSDLKDVDELQREIANLKTSNSELMSSEMAVKEENKKLNTELDLKTDQLKTLNEKVIELEREKAIIDGKSVEMKDRKNVLELNVSENGHKDNEKSMADLDESETEVRSPGEMAFTLLKVGSLDMRFFIVIKTYLRSDLIVKDIGAKRYQDSSVRIVAQSWVKQGLEELAKHLPKNTVIEINDNYGLKVVEMMSAELSLKVLQRMARNDSYNTDGVFNLSNYGPGIDSSVVFSIKDLSRQCVIIGSDWKNNPQTQQKERVFVCDLSGLQFQNPHNTGRLVIVGQNLPKGLLDDFIYEKVVGEPKPTYKDAANDCTDRFVAYNSSEDKFFDTKAYTKFVANDVLTAGLALDKCSKEELNFKFLMYGTRFFGGRLRETLVRCLPEGIAQGLELFLPRQTKIKAIELPFYSINERIVKVCERHDIEIKFSEEEALKRTHPRYMTATTNCSNPHTGTGNRMGFGSIDSAIAENLEGKAIKFHPSINQAMSEVFLD